MKDLLKKLQKEAQCLGVNANFYIRPCLNRVFGDYYCNILLVNKEYMSYLPKKIIDFLLLQENIENVIEKNGFINIFFNPIFFVTNIIRCVKKDFVWGQKTTDCKIHTGIEGEYEASILNYNIEGGSANPTGDLHLAHGRNFLLANTYYKLLKKSGVVVMREYYVNDNGNQMAQFVNSVYECVKNPENLNVQYPGEFTESVANKMLAEINSSPSFEFFLLHHSKKITSLVVSEHFAVIDLFNVKYDYITYESKVLEFIDEVMDFFCKKNVICYTNEDDSRNVLTRWDKNTKGKIIITLNDEEKVLRREVGTWTYFATDICLHWHKIKRGHSNMALFLGADHIGHIPYIKSAVAMMNKDIKYDVYTFAIVQIKDSENNRTRMSKRAGNVVLLKDLIEKIGVDSLKLTLLSYHRDTPIDINIEKMQTSWNSDPLNYIQYAYARICSLIRIFNQQELNIADMEVDSNDFSRNSEDYSKEEKDLMVHISKWQEILECALEDMSPHLVCIYVSELCQKFHSWWTNSKSNNKMRFFSDNPLSTKRRIFVCFALKNIMDYILKDILDITLADNMYKLNDDVE